MKSSSPSFSFPHGSRESLEKVYVSKEHDKLIAPKGSPGAIYDIPSSVPGPVAWSFGSGKRSSTSAHAPIESSIDLTFALPDSQKMKFRGPKGVVFGTEGRGSMKNAAILEKSPQVFYGPHSPGPTAYTVGRSGLSVDPSFFFGLKTKVMAAECQTPENVGPGIYPVTSSVGATFDSRWRNMTGCRFSRAPRHPVRARQVQPVTLIENKPSIGKQPSSKLANPAVAVFGRASRDQVSKTAMCFTAMDRGAASLPLRIAHPSLPLHRDIVKFS
jgi:hypothetical protein